MKISFNKQLTLPNVPSLPEGRYIGTVVQIVGLGEQPGYKPGDAPYAAVGVMIQTAQARLTKMMRLTDSPLSTLFGFLNAALPDPLGYEGDDPLPLTLGRPVAIEVCVKGKFASIASFHRPEDFELLDAPQVDADNLIYLEGAEALEGEAGKALFLKLDRNIRSWLSKRIRG